MGIVGIGATWPGALHGTAFAAILRYVGGMSDTIPDVYSDPLAHWFVTEAYQITDTAAFITASGEQIVAAGIPLYRMAYFQNTLHPEISGKSYIWRRGEPRRDRLCATRAGHRGGVSRQPDAAGGRAAQDHPLSPGRDRAGGSQGADAAQPEDRRLHRLCCPAAGVFHRAGRCAEPGVGSARRF